jgi:hypothetical protein
MSLPMMLKMVPKLMKVQKLRRRIYLLSSPIHLVLLRKLWSYKQQPTCKRGGYQQPTSSNQQSATSNQHTDASRRAL